MRPPTGCSTPCAAGSSRRVRPASNWTRCACAWSKSAAGSASAPTRDAPSGQQPPGRTLLAPPRRSLLIPINNPGPSHYHPWRAFRNPRFSAYFGIGIPTAVRVEARHEQLDHSPRLKPEDSRADHRSPRELGASYTVMSWPEATSTRVDSRRPCGRGRVWHTWSVGVRLSGAPDGARRFLPVGAPRGLRATFFDKR